MTGKHKHIEDVFRETFENHAVKPPKSAWAGMRTSLDNLRLEHLSKSQLSNVSMHPSASLWTRIATRVWWKQFLRFNPARINIYYAGMAIIGGSTAIVSLTNTESGTAVSENTFSVEESFYVEKTNLLHPEKLEEKKQNADFMALRPEVEGHESESTEKQIASVSPSTNKSEGLKNNIVESSGHGQVVSDAETGTVINDTGTPEQSHVADNSATQEKSADVMSSMTVNDEQKREAEAISLVKLPSRWSLLVPVGYALPANNLGEIDARPDTIAYDFAGEPIVKDINFFEQGWYSGVNLFTQDIAFLNNEVKEVYEQNKHHSDFSYRFGLRINMVRNYFMMQTGIYFSSINNVFEHTQKLTLIEDDIDGRVIWPYESDTIYHNTTHKYHNTYSYFEVPVLAGLHLEGINFATNIKTGPVFNYISGVNANLVLNADNQLCSVDKSSCIRPGVRWVISADMIYKFGNKLSVYVEPAYIHDVTTTFDKKLDIRTRFKGFSAGMGIYYRF
ncbi:MAG: hypothetical protein ACOCVX_03190 [Bacteroidales bacterium]